jgi:hypothetical protein
MCCDSARCDGRRAGRDGAIYTDEPVPGLSFLVLNAARESGGNLGEHRLGHREAQLLQPDELAGLFVSSIVFTPRSGICAPMP